MKMVTSENPVIRVDKMKDGSYRASVHDPTPEFCREVVRACLRELGPEREAVGFAAEKVKWALDGEKMVRPDERDEGRVKKLEELLDALRSLLPETEGEA